MAEEYEFYFEIEPVQQQRPRFARRGRYVHTYDPPKTANFKKQLRQLAAEQYQGTPLEGELYVTAKFYRPIQKSLSKKEHVRRASGVHRPIVKSDLSNYLKSFEDALNGIIWRDDAMIVHEEIDKFYSDEPHIELKIKVKEVE